MDLATLRAEIKAWEREFRGEHSRDPTVQEIKDQPVIAAKYKLYKSLSKASSSASLRVSSASRSYTPPRSQPRQNAQPSAPSLLPKARAVKVDPLIQTSNPFSPVKKNNRLKRDDASNTNQSLKLPQHVSHENPFTTPTKPKTHIRSKPSAPRRSPSPDPFPLIQPMPPPPAIAAPRTPAAKSAVTRARKRLRGEPVSPSPIKGKRARVGSQRALAFTSTTLDSDEDESRGRSHLAEDADEPFMEATPMKPPPGGKSFRLLFDEALPGSQDALRQPPNRTVSRTKSIITKPNTVSGKPRALSPSSSEDEDASGDRGTKLQGLITSTHVSVSKSLRMQQKRSISSMGKHGLPRAILPGKDDLWSDIGPMKGPSLKGKAPTLPSDNNASDATAHSATKRSLTGDQPDTALIDAGSLSYDRDNSLSLLLLPPSPPPAESSSKLPATVTKDKGKGKATAMFSRKKARLLKQAGGSEDDSSEDEEDQKHVKVIQHIRHFRRQHTASLDELDESEFSWPSFPVIPPESPPLSEIAVKPGSVEVHLPDELKRVLALSPQKDAEREEERLVKGVLYGRRETHYDTKRGEIWEVGELSEGAEGMDGDAEDEWEGEPVPWEVGGIMNARVRVRRGRGSGELALEILPPCVLY